VKAVGPQREEIKRCVDIFRGQIIDITSTLYTVQLVGTAQKIDAFIAALGEAQILEVARTGVSGIARGEKILAL
jgi:acetolactate synthase-1/3 small subunit